MMTPRVYEYCGLASQLAAEAPGSLRWRYFLVLLDETWEDLSLEERILLDLITDAQEVADRETPVIFLPPEHHRAFLEEAS